MTVLRGLLRPAPAIALTTCLLIITGCNGVSPETDSTEPTVESPAPTWTRDGPARTVTATPAKAAPRARASSDSSFTALDPATEIEAGERHRQGLLQSESSTLSPEEVGYYMDTQEARLTQLLQNSPITLQREQNNILLRLDGGDVFASNSGGLTEAATALLEPVARVLDEYSNTRITIYAHTDDLGEEDYNQLLSERRARSIARQLAAAGVARERIAMVGRGESQPLVSNDTETNRDRNRRIELLIEPLARQD